MVRSELRHFSGVFDPLATFASLRDAGALGDCSYLHLSPDQTEMGWAPVERLRLLAGEPCDHWREEVARFALIAERLGRKAFGYIGFDAVSGHVGTLPDRSETGRPLVEFIIPGETAAFTSAGVTHQSLGRIDLSRHLSAKPSPPPVNGTPAPIVPASGTAERAYVDAVRKAVAALKAGKAKKLVVSRYQAYDADFDPIALFSALQPPFVDAFLICFGDLVAVVPSPELLLSGKHGAIETNPLAGTRPRGATDAEDAALRAELLENHKEIVEHVVSVSTVLSELEPVCGPGSLVVSRFMDVLQLRRVQHLSSTIRGKLAPGRHVLDALWALFPAVTVTGLPKRAAIDAIGRLEPNPRYLYAGTIGWVSGKSDCRFSLALRGLFRCGSRSFLQAGAGILAESVPEAELLETNCKLSAMKDALAQAVQSSGAAYSRAIGDPSAIDQAAARPDPAGYCPPVTSIV
ncbi:MAG TPA: chorismate-binding protein [Stellaceae bacterium]|nr:chorismate-binding protein [Stellaceae bacterium]